MTDTKKTLMCRLGLLVLLVVAAYGSILSHGFVWDDFDIIVDNPLLASLKNVPRFFLAEDRVVAATGFYRPITYLSFAIDRALWGVNPLGFNLTNLLLQIGVVLVFYLVIREMFRKETLAFYAAIVFALHPLAVETVNFHAGGRNTLLSAFFALLSLLFFLKERRIISALFFALAIFSKEFALLLPAVFLFHELRLRGKKLRLAEYLPYLVPIVLYFTLRSLAVEKANLLGTVRLSPQLWLTPYLAVRYLMNMIFPFQLKVMYDEQTSVSVCVACLVLVAALVSAVFLLKRRGELAFADFWFLLFLLPVLNIIPIVSNTLIADRYGYFSLMGFAVAVAALLSLAPRKIAVGVLAAASAAFLVTDISQSGVWTSEETLFSRMAQDAPQMSIGPRNLGLFYYNRGDLAQAERYLLAATERPDIQPQALFGAASILVEANRLDRAEALLLKALPMDPRNPEPYLMLKMISEKKGNGTLADSYLAKAREAIPGLETERAREAAVFSAEGEKFIAQGRYRNAANILWRALLVDPANAAARLQLSKVYERTGGVRQPRCR